MNKKNQIDTTKSSNEVNPVSDAKCAEAADAAVTIAGIGASAGGLAAFEAFFSGMPADVDPGMAFVIVQHLAPDHKSILSDLIRRQTRMAVFEVEDGMKVQANCVYIIPPNCDMALLDGALQLLEPGSPRGQRLPIDFFFRSLAQAKQERAIGIILSGTGSDGVLGVRAIKGEGGLVIAQKPESAEFDGMPLSAIATGQVDFELLPAEMPAKLISYVKYPFGQLVRPPSTPALSPLIESAMKKIFIALRAQTSHDFSNYKPSTVNRRIERRMAVHQIDTIENYARYLQQTPAEVEALFRDLLIGVTNFFRDPDAFQVLEEKIIPKLFSNKAAGAVIRVWVTGCSTGEEAYSIAMLLQERIESIKQGHTVQVFATDIDSRAIATARAGLYPASIAVDITPERLQRFFVAEPGAAAYRIHKSIRDLLIFSEQDMIKDPPFSKLDLVSCRNLLIYLNADLQKKMIPLFHYALNPGGMLFLGTSEGIGEFDELFTVLDRKAKLFQRKDNFSNVQRVSLGRFALPLTAKDSASSRHLVKSAVAAKPPLRELTEQALLQHLAPASALVNAQGDILYLYGRTGMYLEPAPGEPGINNILKMAREGLRPALSSALHKASLSQETVRAQNISVKTNGDFTGVDLRICPVISDAATVAEVPLYLVMLEDTPIVAQEVAQSSSALAGGEADNKNADAHARIAMLEQELRARDEYLQATHEELESSNEELKSANEEMQSVNEELQSTNEEMETSKEELQSVNEELATVNLELQTKVQDLSHANNDMNNLLAGTGIGTVFVDHQLRILRFTPAASQIINLILSDLGRPVAHIASNLVGYGQLVVDIQSVLDTLLPKEMDVQTAKGNWYTMRIQPYRTLDNVIEGAVITFADVTVLKQTEAALRQSANDLLRLAVVVRDSHDAITVQDLDGRILAWNPGAVRMYGWSEAEALQLNARERIPQGLREDALRTLSHLSQAKLIEPYRTQRLNRQGEIVEVSVTSTALIDAKGDTYAIATTERALHGDQHEQQR